MGACKPSADVVQRASGACQFRKLHLWEDLMATSLSLTYSISVSHLHERPKNCALMKNMPQIKQRNRSILCAVKCSMSIIPLPVLVKLCSQLQKNQSHKYLSF